MGEFTLYGSSDGRFANEVYIGTYLDYVSLRGDVQLAPAASLTRRKFLRSAYGGIRAVKISIRTAQRYIIHLSLPALCG